MSIRLRISRPAPPGSRNFGSSSVVYLDPLIPAPPDPATSTFHGFIPVVPKCSQCPPQQQQQEYRVMLPLTDPHKFRTIQEHWLHQHNQFILNAVNQARIARLERKEIPALIALVALSEVSPVET